MICFRLMFGELRPIFPYDQPHFAWSNHQFRVLFGPCDNQPVLVMDPFCFSKLLRLLTPDDAVMIVSRCLLGVTPWTPAGDGRRPSNSWFHDISKQPTGPGEILFWTNAKHPNFQHFPFLEKSNEKIRSLKNLHLFLGERWKSGEPPYVFPVFWDVSHHFSPSLLRPMSWVTLRLG